MRVSRWDADRSWNSDVDLPGDVVRHVLRQAEAQGFGHLDFDDLMAAAIFDVDGAFIQEMRTAGMDRPAMDDLVAMRIHDISDPRAGPDHAQTDPMRKGWPDVG